MRHIFSVSSRYASHLMAVGYGGYGIGRLEQLNLLMYSSTLCSSMLSCSLLLFLQYSVLIMVLWIEQLNLFNEISAVYELH
jgi:hypothetical protein